MSKVVFYSLVPPNPSATLHHCESQVRNSDILKSRDFNFSNNICFSKELKMFFLLASVY